MGLTCSERNEELAARFLDRFLPDREDVADEYPFPELSDSPERTFSDAASLIRHLESKRDHGYALYWDRKNSGDPQQAMLVFTEDGGMIAGVASTNPEPQRLLRDVADVVDGKFGLVVLEERPPDTLEEFVAMCKGAEGIRLVDGQICS